VSLHAWTTVNGPIRTEEVTYHQFSDRLIVQHKDGSTENIDGERFLKMKVEALEKKLKDEED
jgi:hypothetical protein